MMRIEGVAQHYAWGDHEAIPALLGREPDGRPWAELWMGTHPAGPAHVVDGDGRRALADVTGPLPFLFKVLAAAQPLSLQTHPDHVTAERMFAAEQACGFSVTDARRSYRDPYAKPELLCAITEFEVLCGFRPVSDTIAILRHLDHPASTALADVLVGGGIDPALDQIFVSRTIEIGGLVAACVIDDGRIDSITAAIADLARRYPDDPAIAAAVLLNHRILRPGQATYLDAGNLHAYLRGYGVELMGPSDNVLRAGFTAKHVDVDALLAVVDTRATTEPIVDTAEIARGVTEYLTPTPDWRLRRVEVAGRNEITADAPGVVICVDGTTAELRRGESGLIVAGETLSLTGQATVYWAAGRPPTLASA